ncbi:MAG: electron transfer flavoprotein subunit beta/FixA family protein [Micrococcaceae bacterium]|uniref:electron transfer flavoprotein subunit beta/FixA family protein n=1 Tax=unclassified Arthrobacter TaxID=235627 RepID=UPI002655D60E|nr:electron transfer flavoprotein subunit beta/FixA family protein [Micrococcaceae bacterium]MDN5879894.1 electron transfer flavoprotein subunit beta/FixA family protein [Micrococcaceae bacterium]MDN5887439.1 electron transfer flavoprotein subunit beta/FixA family protein [Micrococcaceae bacterium]MDN5906621.1 electron transfer flavoprotein subunit beta/FixA family protein [Micrococcaceae bacterium]MDN6300893.1 electron transfer flavoprotein subunit beta/FixA family protein [Micrococcaceae bact
MKIAVLIKQVPDTWDERQLTASGHVDRAASERIADEITERALEIALLQKDADKSVEVVAVTMGPAQASDALRKALQMGADSARHINDDTLAGADALTTARALAAGLQDDGYDIILAGNESTDGRGGVVPAMIAELLGIPFAGPLNTADFTGGSITGERESAEGTETVSAPLPAVVSITERAAEPRFPKFKGIMTAKRKPVTVSDAATLGLTDLAHDDGNLVLASSRRPARTAGPKIIDEGQAASELIDYLSAEHLI